MVSEAGLDELEHYFEVAEIAQVMEATWMGGGGHPSKFVVVFPGGGGALGKAEDAGGEAPAMIRRERAAWLLARALGWGDLVAATVLRHVEKPSGPALCSLQMIWPAFSPNVPEGSLPEDDRWRGSIFDALIKMADRGGGNWLGVPADAAHGPQRLKLVDHGYAFSMTQGLNSSFYNAFQGQQIPDLHREALENLEDHASLTSIEQLLTDEEFPAFVERMTELRDGVLVISG